MSDKLTLYYSVDNCGDGSAYPRWFDTEALAEWHQDHLDEGWGESCTGTISVEGDNLFCSKLQTKEGYYLSLLFGYDKDEELNEFVSEFFPDGLPEFSVRIIKQKYYGIFVENRLAHKKFAYPEKEANAKGVETLTKLLK
jgi:hypothetical protein